MNQNYKNVDISDAVKILKAGDVVAVPTETVYGLAADASNDTAVKKIFQLKGRPNFNPLIVHCENLEKAKSIAEFTPAALALAEKHWPGPLTLVLKYIGQNISPKVRAGLDTIAIRVPSHPIMQEVLQTSHIYIAAPSANKSGYLSPTEPTHIYSNFPNLPVIDGGKCAIGLESTIIGFDAKDEAFILREGVLQIENLKSKIENKIVAPGMMVKHYAPRNKIRINAEPSHNENETLIGFGQMPCDFNLSVSANLEEAATNLFSTLHHADSMQKDIAVVKISNEGIGKAINDRLSRAASK